MLISKEQEPEQRASVATVAGSAVAVSVGAISETSSEDLLAELTELAAAQKQARQGTLIFYLGGITVYLSAMMITMARFFSNPASSKMGWLLASIVCDVAIVFAGLHSGLWYGRRYYKRNRDRLNSVVTELAARGDARMLPLLLSVMDVRNSGVLLWKECRPVFMDALQTLLSGITQEEFQELSEGQMWEVASLLLYPDGELSQVTESMAVRCGDSRMLSALQKMRTLGKVGQIVPNSPLSRWNPQLRWLSKEGVPFATPHTIEAIDRAIAGVEARIDEARRNAQLLRASAPSAEQVSRELLRAAGPTGQTSQTASDELLRAMPVDAKTKE